MTTIKSTLEHNGKAGPEVHGDPRVLTIDRRNVAAFLAPEAHQRAEVWDLGIRLYHWLQALLVTVLLASGLSGAGDSQAHTAAGFLLCVLLVWRWLWGFVGASSARFRGFDLSWRSVRGYSYKENPGVGHNPLAAWMTLILIIGLSIQGLSGLTMAGALAVPHVDWLHEGLAVWHSGFPKLLIVLLILHVGAAVFHGLMGDGTLGAMVHGKREIGPEDQPLVAPSKQAYFITVAVSFLTLLSIIVLSQILAGY